MKSENRVMPNAVGDHKSVDGKTAPPSALYFIISPGCTWNVAGRAMKHVFVNVRDCERVI